MKKSTILSLIILLVLAIGCSSGEYVEITSPAAEDLANGEELEPAGKYYTYQEFSPVEIKSSGEMDGYIYAFNITDENGTVHRFELSSELRDIEATEDTAWANFYYETAHSDYIKNIMNTVQLNTSTNNLKLIRLYRLDYTLYE
jgi:hypothetical protein